MGPRPIQYTLRPTLLHTIYTLRNTLAEATSCDAAASFKLS
jgi:hypothetical protein